MISNKGDTEMQAKTKKINELTEDELFAAAANMRITIKFTADEAARQKAIKALAAIEKRIAAR